LHAYYPKIRARHFTIGLRGYITAPAAFINLIVNMVKPFKEFAKIGFSRKSRVAFPKPEVSGKPLNYINLYSCCQQNYSIYSFLFEEIHAFLA
jgi:hypothetical protein